MASWPCLLMLPSCSLSSFTLFVRRLPGKEGERLLHFGVQPVLGAAWKCRNNQRASVICFPKLQSWRRADALGVWSVHGTLNPDCFYLGLQGSDLMGVFFEVQVTKNKLLFWKSFPVSGKALSYKALAALHPYWLQGTGETCLVSHRAKLVREF